MKTYTLLIVLVIMLSCCSCNTTHHRDSFKNTNSNLALFCKVWGFLKYYHSDIGGGSVNWDSTLVMNIEIVKSLQSANSIKKFYEELIPSCIESNQFNLSDIKDSLVYDNLNISWIYDTSIFSLNTIRRLDCIYHNSYEFDSKYISKNEWVKNPIFDKDTLYNHEIHPNEKIRLLSLFRYWNIINYYYPYKYMAEISWDSVLNQFIPVFIGARDDIEYHLAVCKLTAMINDNHAYTTSEILEQNYGNRFLPVKLEFIEGKTIISETYSDSLARLNSLKVGDLVRKINTFSTDEIRDSLSVYFSGSNYLSVQNTISYFLPRSSDTILILELCRKDSIFSINCPTYGRAFLSGERKKKANKLAIDTLTKSIAYVDLSEITYENINPIISKLLGFEYLILDLRNNCQFIIFDLCNLLFEKQFIFYSFTTPIYQKPGLYTFQIGEPGGPETINPNHYKGKIIVLIDNGTQSVGEFTAMALLIHENSISIGNASAGADGNVSLITLPGNIKTYISGIGIYWPDGRITQRCGILPTFIVNQQIGGTKINQDDILQYAKKYAKSIDN